MRIVATTVSLTGYYEVRGRTPDHQLIDAVNQQRLVVYEQALAQARGAKADLLCLPGGYFYYAPQRPIDNPITSSDRSLAELIEKIIGLAKEYDVAIAVGLDLNDKDQTADYTKDIRAGTLPWYALCWSPSEIDAHCWNQRSVTSTDQQYCPPQLCDEARIIRIGHSEVEILMCGEAFNVRIREAVTRRPGKPIALVDLAHTLAGFRVTSSLKELAAQGIHALCCGHAEKREAIKYYYAPKAGRRSSSQPDFTCGSAPRLEAKVWLI